MLSRIAVEKYLARSAAALAGGCDDGFLYIIMVAVMPHEGLTASQYMSCISLFYLLYVFF